MLPNGFESYHKEAVFDAGGQRRGARATEEQESEARCGR